ncbi:hypothetical protein Tco_0939201 [Tanacetum coccineum]|uniref:Uncharacterized protein n=1 Tax=Tanacetum coccineum TaxID=301880 RepID=A0ABQ5DJD4_9ASTR
MATDPGDGGSVGRTIQLFGTAFEFQRCGDPNHLIGDYPKPSRNKDQKAFIGVSCSNSENDVEDKTNDETCVMAQSSNEVTLNSSYYSDNASSLDNDMLPGDVNTAKGRLVLPVHVNAAITKG